MHPSLAYITGVNPFSEKRFEKGISTIHRMANMEFQINRINDEALSKKTAFMLMGLIVQK